MRLVAHLSDLHFGRADPALAAALLADLAQQAPDLVAISGDLTQRARSRQFAEARAFLDRIAAPLVVVPGNHDIAPLYRPFDRLLRPRAKFRRLLPHRDFPSAWRGADLVAVGLDSTRPLRWKSGALTDAHLDRLETLLAGAPAEATRLVVLHHPPADAGGGHPFEVLLGHGIDLVLTGHAHRARVDLVGAGAAGALVLVQAGTACSTRQRGEPNGYCLIRLEPRQIEVTVREWNGERFRSYRPQRFRKQAAGWGRGG